MTWFETLSKIEIANNSLWKVLILFIFIFSSFVVGKILKFVLSRSSKKLQIKEKHVTRVTLDSFAKGVVYLALTIGISVSLRVLDLTDKLKDFVYTGSEVLLVISIGYLIYWLIDIPDTWLRGLAEKTESKLDDMIIPIVRKSLRVTLVILILIQIAQVLSDKPITSLIAGLGIGGLAVALAAQDSIKNFFGSIILFIDKPFELGDRVLIDGHDGPIEEVGLRSTKIRTLNGHLVTIPNGELASKTIQNIGKRPYIKKISNITITYDTAYNKISRAIEIIKEILSDHEGMNEEFPPRVYFSDFNACSLNIQVIYWYHPPDYWAFMEFNEKINKEIFKKFGEEGIGFAFPTQTLFLANDPNRPLNLKSN